MNRSKWRHTAVVSVCALGVLASLAVQYGRRSVPSKQGATPAPRHMPRDAKLRHEIDSETLFWLRVGDFPSE
jgi:hypothetical protein